ncbi:MAG: DUF2680 domain-containing protein [Ammonifex sp.]|jgi:hypothetical protein|nr:MAG: DUF2680 domain-containing protein [Ammonifex sp.]
MLKNKSVIIALCLLLALAIAIPALAQDAPAPASPNVTIAPEKAQEITALHKQMLELRSKLIDKYLEAGAVTPEQAQTAKERLQARQQFIEQNPNYVPGFFGRGYGKGFCGGAGRGGCGGCGYWGNATGTQT